MSMPTSTSKDSVSMNESTDKDIVSMTDDLTAEVTGISTPQPEMMMASFRVDRQLWTKFGAIAKRERLTVTDVLTDYIQRCTDKDKTEYAVSMDNDNLLSTDTYDTDKLNDAVRTAVSTLSLPSQDDVSTMISTAIEASLRTTVQVMIESALAPITAQVTELENLTQSQLQAVRDDLKKL